MDLDLGVPKTSLNRTRFPQLWLDTGEQEDELEEAEREAKERKDESSHDESSHDEIDVDAERQARLNP